MLVHLPLLGEVEEACKPFLEVNEGKKSLGESILMFAENHGKNLNFHLNNFQILQISHA
jgi:hypothetical protein